MGVHRTISRAIPEAIPMFIVYTFIQSISK
jgi:hypothetical protein